MSSDGNTVAIGAPFYDNGGLSNRGTTRIYKWSGTAWTIRGDLIEGEDQDERSGWSVSLSSDGNTVAIGSPYWG